eukprot:COSAG01_NODE_16186_length_1262_cov_1.091144_2_plen_266_part_00
MDAGCDAPEGQQQLQSPPPQQQGGGDDEEVSLQVKVDAEQEVPLRVGLSSTVAALKQLMADVHTQCAEPLRGAGGAPSRPPALPPSRLYGHAHTHEHNTHMDTASQPDRQLDRHTELFPRQVLALTWSWRSWTARGVWCCRTSSLCATRCSSRITGRQHAAGRQGRGARARARGGGGGSPRSRRSTWTGTTCRVPGGSSAPCATARRACLRPLVRQPAPRHPFGDIDMAPHGPRLPASSVRRCCDQTGVGKTALAQTPRPAGSTE